MKALVFHGTARFSWENIDDPSLPSPTDMIVRVATTTICGTDLHIIHGEVPDVAAGTVLGHEAVGEVVEVGSDVRTAKPGDRVLVSCITSCGRCGYCRVGTYSQCLGGGGWKLGNAVHGTQAEYVRVPFADTSTHVLPEEAANNEAILVSDVYPTAYEIGVLNGGVSPGDTVVIVGPGPIGLAALGAARLYSAGRVIVVGRSAPRLEVARRLGADAVVSHTENPEQLVREMTQSRGADVVIEAVGSAETFELCTRLVRPAGRIASIGVYGEPATLHLEELWNRNITITTGLVNTHSTPRLLSLLTARLLPVSELATHTFALPDITEAYDTFEKASENRAMKVLLNNPE